VKIGRLSVLVTLQDMRRDSWLLHVMVPYVMPTAMPAMMIPHPTTHTMMMAITSGMTLHEGSRTIRCQGECGDDAIKHSSSAGITYRLRQYGITYRLRQYGKQQVGRR
jgi:hypothetical protein